ncbi:MAG: cytochrome c3 family protein, partial [Planctomycetes bacterium]|nr:cytochrome c3 family protein [Planctomycetota bacterium]
MPNDKGPWCPTRGYLGDSGGQPAPEPASAPEDAGAAEAPAQEAPAAAAPAPSAGGGGDQYWSPVRGYLGSGGGAPAPAAAEAEAPEATPATAEAPAEPVTATKEAPEEEAPAEEPDAPELPELPEADPLRESITTVDSLIEGSAFGEFSKSVFTEPDSETTLYSVSALNVAFAISSAALLVITLVVFWQDYDRQWKHIQAHWRDVQIEESEAGLEAARKGQLGTLGEIAAGFDRIRAKLSGESATPLQGETKKDYGKLADRVEELRAAVEELLEDSTRSPELQALSGLREDRGKKSFDFDKADRSLRAYRGDFQAAKFIFEEAKKHALAEGPTEKALEEVRKLSEEFNRRSVKTLNVKTRILETTKNRSEAAASAYDKKLKTMTTDSAGKGATDFAALEARLKGSLKVVDTALQQYGLIDASMRNALRNAPLLDFMAPNYKIDKVVTPKLKEPLNFMDVERVHRCKTCHINIDDPAPRFVGYQDEKWGSVYASHPRLDLFLAAASPHNYLDIGCTTCHYGDGHAVDFSIAAHTPVDEEQKKHWEDRYHWHEKHHDDYPMLPAYFTSSSCTKCHSDQWEVEGAEKLNLGKKLVRTYGCFGCHKVEGFEVAAGASDDRVWKLNKVGPNLKHLRDKVSLDFLTRWIRQPSHFRESARMPRFFDLTNSRGKMLRPLDPKSPGVGTTEEDYESAGAADSQGAEEIDFDLRNSVEVLGLATYLLNRTPGEKRSGGEASSPGGDPARGRELVKTLGCMGCHSVKVESEGEYEEPLPSLGSVLATLKQKAVTAGGGSALAAAYGETGEKLV